MLTWGACMAERGILFQYGGQSGEPNALSARATAT